MSKLFAHKKLNIVEESPITLDKQQEEAVHTQDNRVLVIAGAGSGKTRVLTERIKYLLSTGVEPSNIVAITFTNMASEEMKSRLRGVKGIGDCFIGTIHSFANQVMRVSGDGTYTILTTDVSNSFFKELIETYCKFLTFDKYLKYLDMRELYDEGKIDEDTFNHFLLPSESAELFFIGGDNTPPPNIDNLNKDDYPVTVSDLCKKHNVITFNDLLILATDYFRKNNSKVEHLLIDEFQDIGKLEYSFFESLQAKNTFYVGDDWQSIYGFKGGNVNIMLNLYEGGEYKVIPITNNYRNKKEILDLATTVINQVPNTIPKDTQVMNTEGEGEVIIGSKEEILAVVELLKSDEFKDNLKDWFILVRTNKELMYIEELLTINKIRNTTFKREGLSLSDLNNLMRYNSVKILTVHTAKGLENKHVVLYGNFPVKVPSYRCNPEERRVMYVGITRAIETLLLLN